jgi:acetyltransferase-like isoleucine patch superfamily enzyme
LPRSKAILNFVTAGAQHLRGRYERWGDPVAYARSLGVKIGSDCRLIGVEFGSEPYLVTLGDHVSATGTQFITHDGGVWVFRDRRPDGDLVEPITVGDNVFLGAATFILPGVTIGTNVVIGAGAVVTRDIPDNCVAVGVPARPIRLIEEYWASVKAELVPTKQLSPAAKREYLESHFGGGGAHR